MKFAVWGLSFKPGTDDMREAPSINLIKSITQSGGNVSAYDPKAIDQAKFYLKDVFMVYLIHLAMTKKVIMEMIGLFQYGYLTEG